MLNAHDLVVFKNKKGYNYSYGVYKVFGQKWDQKGNFGVSSVYQGFQYGFGVPSRTISWFNKDNLHKLTTADIKVLQMEILADTYAYISMVKQQFKDTNLSSLIYLNTLIECIKSRKILWNLLKEKL